VLCTDFKKSHIADVRKQNKDKDMIDLRLGDCLEIMKEIPSKSIDAIICDLPYGTTQCKWDSVIDFEPLWKQYNRIIKNNGAIILFGAEPFSSALRMSNIKNYKYDWVWEKTKASNYLNAKRQPLRANENISIFYKKQPIYNPQMTKGNPYNKGKAKRETSVYGKQVSVEVKSENGLRYPRNVIKFRTAESEGKLHPTQKPLELLEYLVKTYSNENDIILDNTMGSGTTGVACKNLNRKFIGIEKDEKYFKIAESRINSHVIQGGFF